MYKKIRVGYQELNKFFYLNQLMRYRYLSRKKLKEMQLKKFKKLLVYAYNNVPFYHIKYKAAGINPYSIKTEKDILKLPLVSKEEIRKNFPNNIISKKVDIRKCNIAHTSGSTAVPMKIAVDYKNQAVRDAVHEYVRRAIGCDSNKKLIELRTPWRGRKNDFIIRGKNRFVLSSYADRDFQIRHIDKIKPGFLCGTNLTQLIVVVLNLEKEDYVFKKPLNGTISTGEIITSSIRKKIEGVLKTRLFDQYGCAESVEIAYECGMHNGMHEIMPHVYTEILKNGFPSEEMQTGNIVITDLDNYAMPFIRYDFGDVGKKSFEICGCGVKGPLIKSIEGRIQDFVVSSDNRLVYPLIFIGDMSILKKEPYMSTIDQYQIIQDNNKNITIKLVINKEMNQDMINKIIEYIKEHLGDIDVSVEIVDEIEKEKSGKVRIVKSLMGVKKLKELLK